MSTPDLDSILKTLSQYPSSNQAQHESQLVVDQYSTVDTSAEPSEIRTWAQQPQVEEDEDIYEPPEPVQRITPANNVQSRPIDPVAVSSTIIDWSAGLRHVTKLAARNEALGRSVQKMIRNQRQNERDWWAGREALIQRQKDRVQDKAKLDDMLRSIGGLVSTDDGPEPATEIAQYDRKVYWAQEAMVKAVSADLAGSGVPFFGTQKGLVKENDELTNDDEPDTQRKISRGELVALQRKMLTYLEDMYG